jgi:superfamily II DNA/RNA helicase
MNVTMNIPKNIPPEDKALIEELLNDKPPEFTDLKQTQYETFSQGGLSNDNHVLVASTGNGKTLCAEAVTKKSLKEHKKVAYLVPSRSLVHDKHESIQAWAPETALVTKESGYNSADVIVATFESYFEAVIRGYSDRFSTVILDDFHEIYESHRGPTIEKGIAAALDQNCEVFAMSATIGNPKDIANWMNANLTVSSEKRAVPIEERPVKKTDDSYATQISNIIKDNPDKGPFIVFCDTTRNVESRALGIADKATFDTTDDIDFKQLVKDCVSTDLTDDHKELISALRNGVGYHHSQMEADLKEEIASLAEKGAIKCITATTSLSYGFNSPVQSAITADLKRYTQENGRTHIGKHEYIQMIGRAGRNDETYDKAYAFPMYNDEETIDEFQFNTPLNEKEIEDVATHLSSRRQLRWLILELVNNGWGTKEELLNFLSNTLYWEEVSQKYESMKNGRKFIAEEINASLSAELKWLVERELVIKQDSENNQSGLTDFATTQVGNAIVEYHHSNWFSNSVSDVHDIAKWVRTEIETGTLTPEKLIQHIAKVYERECKHNIGSKNIEFLEKINEYGLFNSEGQTAAAICWYWNHGFSLNDIEEVTGTESQSRLPSTARNIATAVSSLTNLFEPDSMPTQPKWIASLNTQINTGICGVDTHLINKTDQFGRKRYYNLTKKFDQLRASDDNKYGKDAYLIEQLYEVYKNENKDMFTDIVVKGVEDIGQTVGEEIYKTIDNWHPKIADQTTVPYEHSPRAFTESQYEQSPHVTEAENVLLEDEIANPPTEPPNTESSIDTTDDSEEKTSSEDENTDTTSLDDFV